MEKEKKIGVTCASFPSLYSHHPRLTYSPSLLNEDQEGEESFLRDDKTVSGIWTLDPRTTLALTFLISPF